MYTAKALAKVIRKQKSVADVDVDMDPMVRLWVLRVLVPGKLHMQFMRKGRTVRFNSDTLAYKLGLSHWVDAPEWDYAAVLKELFAMYQQAEAQASSTKPPIALRKNTEKIAKMIGLSEVDSRIVEFAALVKTDTDLDGALDGFPKLNINRSYSVMATILGLSVNEIRAALLPAGNLSRAGIINFSSKSSHSEPSLQDRISLPSQSFANILIDEKFDRQQLMSDMAKESSKPELRLRDYPHVQKHVDLLLPYLRQSTATSRKGVNVLIYGPPGTGKTQFAKVLAKELKLSLFEVADEDGDGYPMDGETRLRAYRRAQHFLRPKNAMLVFDEVEDIFGYGSPVETKTVAKTHKALMNRTLEESNIPTVWLSNSIRGIDGAAIRRFDFAFELPIPPKKQREKILAQASKGLLSKESISRMAECENLVPAVLTRAAAIIQVTRESAALENAEQSIEFLLNNTLEAQGHRKIRAANDPNRISEVYDPAFINSDIDLTGLADGLRGGKGARICLYGPAGTGKTAYGRWLAKTLDKPLLIKRASDLIDMFVGGTEKNIARAFEQASEDGAILLIDEVDSFLQDRRGATRSWEVTGVNEMLTQMESFAGIFIASTNLMGNLDQAALRRFDLKAYLNYLHPEQARQLFERYCKYLSIGNVDAQSLSQVAQLSRLAPGDFAAAARQHRFSPFANPQSLLKVLAGECEMKEGGKRASIGFF